MYQSDLLQLYTREIGKGLARAEVADSYREGGTVLQQEATLSGDRWANSDVAWSQHRDGPKLVIVATLGMKDNQHHRASDGTRQPVPG